MEDKQDKKSFAAGLLEFLREYSVIGMAIGVIVAQSSKSLIDALVNGFFTPLIELVAPGREFSRLVFSVRGVRFDIGSIVSSLLTFLIVMVILYVVVRKILKREDLLRKK